MQTLSRHIEDIRPLVKGVVLYGDEGAIDVAYDGAKVCRADAISADLNALRSAGYRARIVGRNVCLAIDLTNVGDAFNARFVK